MSTSRQIVRIRTGITILVWACTGFALNATPKDD